MTSNLVNVSRHSRQTSVTSLSQFYHRDSATLGLPKPDVRRVGVEVLRRDLWIGGLEAISGEESRTGERREGEARRKGLGEWRELCALWGGMWIVNLTIKGSLRVKLLQTDPGEPSSSAAPEGATTSASASASASASPQPPLFSLLQRTRCRQTRGASWTSGATGSFTASSPSNLSGIWSWK
ncbi:hypothetical protein MBM_05327 [Drepanopeziza brunnea f. sp. 'multigermtubi' MB_m1]|uniref:Uncharacterized protein n=1 Tax=Marssonina brunnea f. sp. multigermtubi (strain MB_m1) TaxID=1072389 RepID=K1X863_MARBU|nr:uncharacterized protein MBM_05327 [Drepanopeziza brunnea f. sp. 'multigermtubi' MB_m1]EKD16858.1 hypothetical protein MBM_05327 [Drepanopeziza brunnea f. sp. 'multigermtubi' MB_m1]